MADSPEFLHWHASTIHLCLRIRPDEPVSLLPLGIIQPTEETPSVPLVEIDAGPLGRDGSSPPLHRGYSGTGRLRYIGHEETHDRLTVSQRDTETGLVVATMINNVETSGVIRVSHQLRNAGSVPVPVRYVSSFQFPILGQDLWQDARIQVPHSTHRAEFRWDEMTLRQAGLVYPGHPEATTHGRYAVQSTGTRSSGAFLPAGCVETGTFAFAWQIEHNGAWQWGIDEEASVLRVRVSGPAHQEHHWRINLAQGAEFTTVPVSLSVSDKGFHETLRQLTSHRRAIRRPHVDNERLPIIYNVYMNGIGGNPTTENLVPLIEAARDLGAEYFVIDAGWYSNVRAWWPTVGEWRESPVRFPGGLSEVMEKIRKAGMAAGLWLEPEVVGVDSPVADELPHEAFFCWEGQRILTRGRYHLDYRHPLVIQHMNDIVDRLVRDYGIDYFKFDYNINPGNGTDVNAASLGDGLLGHNRAFLAWIDDLLDRHEGLVIENCASGGLRVDYAQLASMSIQSTSDQTSSIYTVPIAAAAPSALAPEQAGIWAYPAADFDDELNALTMVNALLGRVHLSGHINRLEPGQLALVGEALDVYRQIRGTIKNALPSWPLGLPHWYDEWVALALDHDREVLLAVWHRGEEADSIRIDMPAATAELLYPVSLTTDWKWDADALDLTLPPKSARLFRLSR